MEIYLFEMFRTFLNNVFDQTKCSFSLNNNSADILYFSYCQQIHEKIRINSELIVSSG